MSRAVLIASIALMLGSTIAEAQEQRQRSDRPGRPGPANPGGGLPPGAGNKLPPGAGPNRPGRPEVRPPRPGNGGPAIQPPRPGRPEIQPPRPGKPEVRPPVRPPVVVRPPRPGAGRPPHGGGNWHRPPTYRPGWNYPRGYSYRRYATGLILPTIFLSSAYYFTDYNTLGLYAPPKGYRWVRYGPDLLLVRKKNGRIKEVYYNVFR